MFFSESCNMKNTFFTQHLQATASEIIWNYTLFCKVCINCKIQTRVKIYNCFLELIPDKHYLTSLKGNSHVWVNFRQLTLREKCPYSELFWSVFRLLAFTLPCKFKKTFGAKNLMYLSGLLFLLIFTAIN